jgi:hypothetical protein
MTMWPKAVAALLVVLILQLVYMTILLQRIAAVRRPDPVPVYIVSGPPTALRPGSLPAAEVNEITGALRVEIFR